MAATIAVFDSLHSGPLHCVEFDFFASRLATASSDRTIRVWHLHPQTGGCQLKTNLPHTGVGLWADGVVGRRGGGEGGEGKGLAETEATLLQELHAHEGPVWQVRWAHPSFGSLLASCGYDKRIVVWQQQQQGSECSRAALLSDYGLAQERPGGAARGRGNANTPEPPFVPVYCNEDHAASVNALAFAPPEWGLMLAAGSSDGSISILIHQEKGGAGNCVVAAGEGVPSAEGWMRQAFFTAHFNGVYAVDWAAPAGCSPALEKGDEEEGAEKEKEQGWGGRGGASNVDGSGAVTPMLASGGADCQVRIWGLDERTGSWVQLQQLKGSSPHTDWVRDVAFQPASATALLHPSSLLLASCGEDSTVKLWVYEAARSYTATGGGSRLSSRTRSSSSGRGKQQWRLLQTLQLRAPVWRIAWSASGTLLSAACGEDEVVLFRETVSGVWETVSKLSGPPPPQLRQLLPGAPLHWQESEQQQQEQQAVLHPLPQPEGTPQQQSHEQFPALHHHLTLQQTRQQNPELLLQQEQGGILQPQQGGMLETQQGRMPLPQQGVMVQPQQGGLLHPQPEGQQRPLQQQEAIRQFALGAQTNAAEVFYRSSSALLQEAPKGMRPPVTTMHVHSQRPQQPSLQARKTSLHQQQQLPLQEQPCPPASLFFLMQQQGQLLAQPRLTPQTQQPGVASKGPQGASAFPRFESYPPHEMHAQEMQSPQQPIPGQQLMPPPPLQVVQGPPQLWKKNASNLMPLRESPGSRQAAGAATAVPRGSAASSPPFNACGFSAPPADPTSLLAVAPGRKPFERPSPQQQVLLPQHQQVVLPQQQQVLPPQQVLSPGQQQALPPQLQQALRPQQQAVLPPQQQALPLPQRAPPAQQQVLPPQQQHALPPQQPALQQQGLEQQKAAQDLGVLASGGAVPPFLQPQPFATSFAQSAPAQPGPPPPFASTSQLPRPEVSVNPFQASYQSGEISNYSPQQQHHQPGMTGKSFLSPPPAAAGLAPPLSKQQHAFSSGAARQQQSLYTAYKAG